MKPYISVVIPAHNRKDELERVLAALKGQSIPKTKYEIIVVDDSIPPLNPENVKLIHIPPSGHTRARNEGIKQANGEIIAFTDDDCIPQIDWLEKLSSHFRDPSVSGVEGKTVAERMKIDFHAAENLEGGKFPTCNIAFRKNALEEAEGFDEKYGFFREDTDLAFAILKRGGKIVFSENAIVFHPPRKISLFSPLRELRMIKSDIRLFKKFPELYRSKIGFVGGGGVKISAFAWLMSLIAIIFLSILPLLLVVLLKYFAHLRKRIFSLGWIWYIAVSWIRDLLYPFYFSYYYLTENADKQVVKKTALLKSVTS